MLLKLMISEARFVSKEECIKHIPAIKKNHKCKSYIKEVTTKELERYILEGHMIVPSILEEDKPLRDEYFKGTQVFGLDFDNMEEVIIDGVKTKQRAGEELYLTLHKIVDRCCTYGIKPFMIYETFSSTDDCKRYRALFATEDIITDVEHRKKVLQSLMDIFYVNGIPAADISCKDISRVFFGGKAIVYEGEQYLDELKAINVATNINRNKKDKNASKDSNDASLKGEGFLVHTYQDINKYKDYVCTKNISLIKARDYKGLRAILGPINIEFSSFNECINYITHGINMAELLGIKNDKSFSCIFHQDNSPSAGITRLEDGQYFYKCFSSNCGFKGNFITVIAELLGSSRLDSIKFIQKVYDLRVTELEWVIEHREELKENTRMIMDGELKEIYPVLNSVISRYYRDLLCIHEIAMQNILYKDLDGNIIFFVSQNKLATILNTEQSSICRRIALFALLKMINKIDDEKIPKDLRKKSEEISRKNNKKDTIQYYSILSFTWANLSVSNSRAINYKEKHCTMKGMSRELIYRSFGEELADEIYPKRKTVEPGEESIKFKNRFQKYLLNTIAKDSYATETKVLNKLKGYKALNEIMAKRVLAQVLEENHLKRVRANKELKEKYNIKSKGYPFIIVEHQK
ncbi:hypothetical protein [Tissierella sp.]|uniref:hypothetical protein n=1 Tax=Tissierella sp. TaxID=41274 RepID=UPI0030280FEB